MDGIVINILNDKKQQKFHFAKHGKYLTSFPSCKESTENFQQMRVLAWVPASWRILLAWIVGPGLLAHSLSTECCVLPWFFAWVLVPGC